jgi:ribosomal protein L11 methylase PrmA
VGQWLVEQREVWAPPPVPSIYTTARATKQSSAVNEATLTNDPLPPFVLDLGCGMGLAGTVAALLGARVLLGDIETACLLFARLNAERYGGDRVAVRRIDWHRVLLGEPGRQTGDSFQPWIRKKGWTLHVHSQRVPTRLLPIRLLELTLS